MSRRCDCSSLLRWETAPGVVHPALCGSHGNKTLQPQEVGHMGILGSWTVRSGSHSGVVYEVAGERNKTHTHTGTDTHVFTQIPKIHQHYSPSCITVTALCARFQSSLPPPWQPSQCFTWVKLILSGWPDGWRGPKLAGGSQGFKGCN